MNDSVLDTIYNLCQSMLDEFENDDTAQQLSYCKNIAGQIQQIIRKVKNE